MLPRSSNTSYSSVKSLDGVQLLQEYLADLKSRETEFPSISEDDADGKNDNSSAQERENTTSNNGKFSHLLSRYNFQEMLESFFVMDHNRLFVLRANIRQENDFDNNSLFILGNAHTQKIHELRLYYYQGQTFLFRLQKGKVFDSLL